MRPSANRRIGLILAIGAPALAGCGPTEAEIGAMLTSACIPLMLLGLLIQWLYRKAWIQLGRPVEFNLRPTVIAFVLTCLLNVCVLTRLGPLVDDDWWIVAVFGGASFMTVFLIVIRVAIHRSRGFSTAVWWPFMITVLPAALFGLFGVHSSESDRILLLAIPGGLGYGFVGVFLFLALELAIRAIVARKRKKQRTEDFPVAQVRKP